MKKNKLSMRGKEIAAGYMFLLPWLIGFFVFSLYPIIYSVMLSLNEVHITSTEGVTFTWKGVQYFYEALRVDTSFLTILGESVTFICFATPIILVFSLVIAILLNHEFPGRTFFRVLFFFPVIIMSGSVISELLGSYTLDFSQMSGVVYNFLNSLPGILQKPIFFALNNLVLILWFCGVQILLFLAALQKVGREVYEAAEVDGASSWEKFWKITLPHIKSMILVNAVYTVMEIANYSNNEVLEKISSHMFEVTRPYSFSAAMSWIYFLVIAMILLVIFLLFGRKGKNDV